MIMRLWRLFRSPLWPAVKDAVAQIAAHIPLQAAAAVEDTLAYCPRCGQRPDGDRRMEEARLLVIETIGHKPRRSDLDFLLSLAYWLKRT